MTQIREWYITFGVQYGRRQGDEHHPLGMFSDGYAVIEAPTHDMARAMAFAIFEQKWAFLYSEPPGKRHAPAGELLRIAWIQHDEEVVQSWAKQQNRRRTTE
jgi:hypothetical protein